MVKSLVVSTLLLIGCENPMAVAHVEGVAPFADTQRLSIEWAKVEACSGLSRDFRSVKFYTVTEITYKDGFARGLWDPNSNRIYILITESANTKLIDHEVMHALLRRTAGHPVKYFSDVCGNLIDGGQS